MRGYVNNSAKPDTSCFVQMSCHVTLTSRYEPVTSKQVLSSVHGERPRHQTEIKDRRAEGCL